VDVFNAAKTQHAAQNPQATDAECDAQGQEALRTLALILREDKEAGTTFRVDACVVCNEPSCLIAAGMKTVDEFAKWHKQGCKVDKRGNNTRYDQRHAVIDGLAHVRNHLFNPIAGITDAEEKRIAQEEWNLVLEDVLQRSFKLRDYEKKCATTAFILANKVDGIDGLTIPDSEKHAFVEIVHSAALNIMRALCREHVQSADFLADAASKTNGRKKSMEDPKKAMRMSWRTYVDKVILKAGLPTPMLLCYVYHAVMKWKAMGCPRNARGKPEFRVYADEAHGFWGGIRAQEAVLVPILSDDAVGITVARLHSASSADVVNGANRSNAFADAKRANPEAKKYEILQLMRAMMTPGDTVTALVHKNSLDDYKYAALDHSVGSKGNNLTELLLVQCVHAAIAGLRLESVISAAEAETLLLKKGAQKGDRARFFTKPKVVQRPAEPPPPASIASVASIASLAVAIASSAEPAAAEPTAEPTAEPAAAEPAAAEPAAAEPAASSFASHPLRQVSAPTAVQPFKSLGGRLGKMQAVDTDRVGDRREALKQVLKVLARDSPEHSAPSLLPPPSLRPPPPTLPTLPTTLLLADPVTVQASSVSLEQKEAARLAQEKRIKHRLRGLKKRGVKEIAFMQKNRLKSLTKAQRDAIHAPKDATTKGATGKKVAAPE
jgi:phage terminase Nu1 subunit (DNA packaging protein)